MRNLIFCLLLFPLLAFAQNEAIFRIDSLPKEGVLLNQGWKWHAGDNPEWSKAEFNDSKWESIDPTKSIFELPQLSKKGEISWFRLHFSYSKHPLQQVAGMLQQTGASEIYLNGKLLERYGVLTAPIEAFNPRNTPLLLPIDAAGQNCLAIRYVLQPGVRYNGVYNSGNQVFLFRIANFKEALKLVSQFDIRYTNLESYKLGIFFILFVLHFSLYFFNRNQKAHLSVAFAFLAIGVAHLFKLLGDVQNLVAWKSLFFATSSFINNLAPLLTLQTLFLFLNQKRGKFFWFLVALTVGLSVLVFIGLQIEWGMAFFILSFLVTIEQFRAVINGIRTNIRGAWILAIGVILNTFFYLVLFSFIGYFISVSPTLADIVFNLGVIAFPIALSIYLGIDSAYTNKELNQKLSEVETLSVEKQQLLATQNETLELQVAERTAEISEKNRELQVEASLDRVRARALSMQLSNEVMDVANTLYEELQKLDFKYGASTIMIMHDESSSMEHWVAGFDHLKYPESYRVNYFDHPCYNAQFEAWRNSQKYLVYTLAGDEKKAYDEQMFDHNDYKKFPAAEQQWMRAGESVIFSLAFMKHGALHWGPTPLSEEKAQVLQRFAAVFEQAYTRFLDLQKAETQAREAQIEVALERIRAKALAMESSTQINTVIAIIYRECNTLLLDLTASLIIIYNETTLDTCWYLAKQEDPDFPSGFKIPYNKHPFSLAMLDGWEQKSNDWGYILKADEKIAWDDFIFSETDFSLLPDIVKNAMRSEPTLYTCAAFGDFGCIMLGTLNANSKEQKIILSRITNVFDFAYTRFKDLQQKEKLAKQAEEDLIKLKEEKRKTDQAITELKSTQAQLIQSEKLASLGELTAGIAHEIQNPLNFVNNFAEVSSEMLDEMEEELDKGDTQEAKAIAADLKQNLSKINHHGQRASSIVKGMLEHSRASTGVKEPTDINALADEYLRLAYHGLRAKDNSFNATMKTHFDPDFPLVSVIPQDIGRVLLNLINNAFYAVNEKQKQIANEASGNPLSESFRLSESYTPTIIVSTKRQDNAIEICIQDNGNGIPEAIKDKIFQPFFTTKPTGQGTGLGLSLAYDIVTKGHGGTLEILTSEGAGSTFITTLKML
ncbi:MAG TPA: ATP-binding protein [Haliscomenobacter sp.]|uniref:ATP-binding protein n=1 Tax=Haliscomenobacter sp. TaxID=2717303 RepID=UPI002BF50C79|nr:ATP-binding protein [Haliscomenobacter sp.]HOY17064.1 ATP-binding protein [Haliscomenobacter sp.]